MEEELSERVRAEDILLGSIGYGEGASLVSLTPTSRGYAGVGRWADGEEFEFECDEELDELQQWALGVLLGGEISFAS